MFGAGSSTPFGSPSGGFGQTNSAPGFGSPAPAPFGAPAPSAGFGGFGAPAPAPTGGFGGGFGAPAPAPTGGFGGGFGTPAPAPSAFGGSTFGAPAATSSPFGAPAPAPGGLFGSTASPAPSGGLFGSAPPPAPGGFGGATSTFGGGGGFGATTNPTQSFGGGASFGAPAPATGGLFGSTPAPAPGGFGATGFGSTAGAFGAPAPAPSSGLFGAPAPAAGGLGFGSPAPVAGGGGGGTRIAQYAVTNRQDGQSNINLQAITAMPQYESKSFEELRFEDYSQGNRGGGAPGAAPGGFGGGFGAPAPAPSGGLFGAPAPAPGGFGAPAPAPGGFGGFGAPAPAPFGAPAPAAFGATAPGQFGAPAAPAGFGSPAPAPGGAFGSTVFGAQPPAPGGLFGAPAPAPGGGLFGAPPAAPGGGLFGAPGPAPGGFGSPAPAPGLFGAPTPGAFGAPAPGGFGAPAPAPFGGGFGSPAPALGGGLFGAPAPAPGAYGVPAQGGMFGAPAAAPGGSYFGAPPAVPGAYGAPQPSGLFGAPAPVAPSPYGVLAPAPGMFGPPALQMAMPAAPAVGSVMPPAADEILASQVAALEKQRKELEKQDNFRKTYTASSLVSAASMSERDALSSSMLPIRASYSPYRASPKSSAVVRPRGFASPEKTATLSLRRLGTGGKPMAAPDTLAASSATRLIINPSPKPKLKLSLQADRGAPSLLKTNLPNGSADTHGFGLPPTAPSPATPASQSSPRGMQTPNSNGNRGYDYYREVVGSPGDGSSAKQSNVAPTLSKAGYKCDPSIENLRSMTPEDLAAVANFSIERAGFGKIEWEGAVDVRGISFDRVVSIESKTASVYMKEEEEGQKPAVGTKLNRSAIITLEGVYAPEATIDSEDKFSRKVKRQTQRMGADLIDYDSKTGVWKLRVQHFSKYGLDDDDSESEAEQEATTRSVNFEAGERDGRSRATSDGILKQRKGTPYKPQKVKKRVAIVADDEEMELASDVEMTDDTHVLEDAEAAFTAMQTAVKEQLTASKVKREETAPFPDECKISQSERGAGRYIPTAEDLAVAALKGGLCSGVARKAGVKGSSTDFGKRMRGSFRVGWCPDGSFFKLQASGVLTRQRPKFTDGISTGDRLGYLEKHQASAEKLRSQGDCPQFSLPTGQRLQAALGTYIQGVDSLNSGKGSTAGQSFALLKCLLAGGKGSNSDQLSVTGPSAASGSISECRRIFAVQQWLVEACAEDVACEIKDAKLQHKKNSALLAAVTGGDVDKACVVADELGLHELATMIAAGPHARVDILRQAMAWNDDGAASRMPSELIRCYFQLGGDLNMEEDIYKRKYSPFDWKRRLTMTLSYGSITAQSTLSSLITDYDNKVTCGSTPYPQPAYLAGQSRQEIQCVMYRLLRLGTSDLEIPLSEIIDPIGYTSAIHDFSLAFSLAAAVSAMGCSFPLTEIEEQSLIDGYSAQLATAGHWEWAVYVSLCIMGRSTSSTAIWKQQRAKSLVLRNFRELDHGRRRFLERIGVPSMWFEEALAFRCATSGDAFGYLRHMVNVKPEEACLSLESTIIPNMLFMDRESLSQARTLLGAFTVDSDSLAGAVYDFFQIYEEIIHLERAPGNNFQRDLETLLARSKEIERVFASYQSGEAKLQGPSLRIIPDTKTVPLACFLAEALSQISLFKLQLRALESGLSLSSTASQILNLAQPTEIQESGMLARENILRWLM